MKIAIIYNTKFPYTTGFYCEKALIQLGHEVEHIEHNVSVSSKFDFFLNVDDDVPYFLQEKMRPNVYWVSDTHRANHQWRFDKCNKADILFVSQKDALLQFQKTREKVFWMPHACDISYHSSNVAEKKYDIGFVGNISSRFHIRRKKMIEVLKKNFENVKFVDGLYLNDMADLYRSSKIVFNCSLNNDINMRLFEGMCSGSMVLTDEIPYLFEVVDRDSIVTYRDENELVDKARYYLDCGYERKQIALKGFFDVRSKHTYEHRMKDLVSIVQGNI